MKIPTVAHSFVVSLAACACAIAGVATASAAHMPASLANADRGGHYWFRYCEGQPDGTALPPDPRFLVTPTSDKAVVFNVASYSCLNQQASSSPNGTARRSARIEIRIAIPPRPHRCRSAILEYLKTL